jgi:two-component system response regulator HydG
LAPSLEAAVQEVINGHEIRARVRPLAEVLAEVLGPLEKRTIDEALQAFNGNRQETADALEINRTTLYKKMRAYELLADD